MMKARYGVNIILGIVAGVCAFVISQEIYDYLHNRFAASLVANSDCPDKTIVEIVKDYKPEILPPQIQVLMNNALRDVGVTKLLVRQSGMNYVIAQQVTRLAPEPIVYTLGEAYCSDMPAFRLARSIGAKLIWAAVDGEGHTLQSEVFSPDQCRVTTIQTENGPTVLPPATNQ